MFVAIEAVNSVMYYIYYYRSAFLVYLKARVRIRVALIHTNFNQILNYIVIIGYSYGKEKTTQILDIR